MILDAYKLHVAVKVSEELLYDNAFNLETYLLNSFAKALGNAEEEAFLTGDGKNKPTGILNAIGVGEVAADSIKADEVIDLVSGRTGKMPHLSPAIRLWYRSGS